MKRDRAEVGLPMDRSLAYGMTALRYIVRIQELAQGQARKFQYLVEGRKHEGFVTLIEGQVVAYQNTCRHIPLSLDYGDGRFFQAGSGYLVCCNHGAVFDPRDGLCIRGPCQGLKLIAIAIELYGDAVWLKSGAGRILPSA